MSDRPDESDEAPTPVAFEPARDLPGAVLMIPNKHWDIPGVTSEDHPGACAYYRDETRDAILVSGTDADNVRWGRYFFVDPTDDNGLDKRTAFKLVPRYFRLHRLKLYFPERYRGRLDGETLQKLRDELARLNP